MKKIRSIFLVVILFLMMVIISFLILYRYSAVSMKASLKRVASIQMDYSGEQLDRKQNEIEIEAGGIVSTEAMKELQLAIIDEKEVYDYVMAVNAMKELFLGKQRLNVGIADFVLFWPESGRVVSTVPKATVDKELYALLREPEANGWLICGKHVYYCCRCRTGWEENDEEPILVIQMDRNWLYKVKSMAAGFPDGGTLCLEKDGSSIFPLTQEEEKLRLDYADYAGSEGNMFERKIDGKRYQIVRSRLFPAGLLLVTYYPLDSMMFSVLNMNYITGVLLLFTLLTGTLLLALYYKNILVQLRLLTGKLKQVEEGDLAAQIDRLPHNEFGYVFGQFNRMTSRMEQLFITTMKEQELRSQAELEQLQLQINPHFLYNSLSYIVTMAGKPELVQQMAVHLADYYRYCSRKKLKTTIREELSYARTYLSIMAMRKKIEYTIHAAEDLQELPIIPLILEPIIENAVEHGIEGRESAGKIRIDVLLLNGFVRFEISDDGEGLNDKERETLKRRIRRKERQDKESVGLWNVNQRLINSYSESAQLAFSGNSWGGLTVYFEIDLKKIEEKRWQEEETDAGIDR